jgi:hypothetical protein
MWWSESESERMKQRVKKAETKNQKINGEKWVKGRTAEIKTENQKEWNGVERKKVRLLGSHLDHLKKRGE